MAQHLRIRCIVQTDRTTAHARIYSVGGIKPDGTSWKLTQEEAISYIEDGKYIFCIERPAISPTASIKATNSLPLGSERISFSCRFSLARGIQTRSAWANT